MKLVPNVLLLLLLASCCIVSFGQYHQQQQQYQQNPYGGGRPRQQQYHPHQQHQPQYYQQYGGGGGGGGGGRGGGNPWGDDAGWGGDDDFMAGGGGGGGGDDAWGDDTWSGDNRPAPSTYQHRPAGPPAGGHPGHHLPHSQKQHSQQHSQQQYNQHHHQQPQQYNQHHQQQPQQYNQHYQQQPQQYNQHHHQQPQQYNLQQQHYQQQQQWGDADGSMPYRQSNAHAMGSHAQQRQLEQQQRQRQQQQYPDAMDGSGMSQLMGGAVGRRPKPRDPRDQLVCPADAKNVQALLEGGWSLIEDDIVLSLTCFTAALDLAKASVNKIPVEQVHEIMMSLGDTLVELGRDAEGLSLYQKVTRRRADKEPHRRHAAALSRVTSNADPTDQDFRYLHMHMSRQAREMVIDAELNPRPALPKSAHWYSPLFSPNQMTNTEEMVNNRTRFYNLLDKLQCSCEWTEQYHMMVSELPGLVQEYVKGSFIYTEGDYQLTTFLAPMAALHFLDQSDLKSYITEIAERAWLDALQSGFEATKRWPTSQDKTRKIRIGYLAHTFDAPELQAFASVPGKHDHSKFEVFVYTLRPQDKSLSANLTFSGADHIIHPSESISNLAELANQISQKDKIDILVDLDGMSELYHQTLFAAQPAPIQISALSWPWTSGQSAVQYTVVDNLIVSPEQAASFTEKFISLPFTAYVMSHYEVYPQLLEENEEDEASFQARKDEARAKLGIPAGAVVFGSFEELWKLDPQVWNVWMNILNATNGSHLLLHAWGPPDNQHNLRNQSEAAGVDPTRIVFVESFPAGVQHLEQKRLLVDIVLDTIGYSGLINVADALWAGIPVVAIYDGGAPVMSRRAGSLLRAMELVEDGLLVSSVAEYQIRALQLAASPEWRRTLSAKILRNRLTTPLFNTGVWVEVWEKALVQAFEAYVDRVSPLSHIFVNTIPVPPLQQQAPSTKQQQQEQQQDQLQEQEQEQDEVQDEVQVEAGQEEKPQEEKEQGELVQEMEAIAQQKEEILVA